MVNNKLKEQREARIAKVMKMVKTAGKNFDKKNMVMEICIIWGVQQRKAAEYLRIAQHMLK